MKKKPVILFDYSAFHLQRFGGVSRYFYEIISRMKRIEPVVALLFSMNKYISDDDIFTNFNMSRLTFKILEGILRKLNRRGAVKKIKASHFDIFHPTYYDPYFLNVIGDKPFVLTIHDMTHEMYPQYFSSCDQTAFNKRLLAEKASRIIAISEYTKSKIVEILGVDDSKIDVIYHGLDKREIQTGKPKCLPEKYILYVGERRKYKNFDSLVDAFAQLSSHNPDMHLVLTGRKLSSSESLKLTTLGLKNKVKVYSDISDTVLDQLYHNAQVFVYPSLCEGFGIPILEAFAQDCPVVLSNLSCFPEIGGDACEYFQTDSTDDLLRAINEVIGNDSYRNQLIANGRERLKLFDWNETARKTEETYIKVYNAVSK